VYRIEESPGMRQTEEFGIIFEDFLPVRKNKFSKEITLHDKPHSVLHNWIRCQGQKYIVYIRKTEKLYNFTSVPCVLYPPPILFCIIWLPQSELVKGRNCEVTYEAFSKVPCT
jgi:hypothetical protein